MYSEAAEAASPRGEMFEERPSSSMMTGSGMMMVHLRLSTRDENMEREDKRILVSMTRVVWPGTARGGWRTVPAFRGPRGRRLESGGEGTRCEDSTELCNSRSRACKR